MKFLYRKFAVVVVAEKLLRFLFSDEKDQEVGDKVNGELHLELSGFYRVQQKFPGTWILKHLLVDFQLF